MGRDPKLYENPNDFQPERFERDDPDGKSNHFQYTPFSAGPRNCIGQKFAMLEMKATVSKLLRNFEFRLSENTLNTPLVLSAELILISKDPLYFNIRPRSY